MVIKMMLLMVSRTWSFLLSFQTTWWRLSTARRIRGSIVLPTERKRSCLTIIMIIRSRGLTSELREIFLICHILHHLNVRLLTCPDLLLLLLRVHCYPFSRRVVLIRNRSSCLHMLLLLTLMIMMLLREWFLQVLRRWRRHSMVRITTLSFFLSIVFLIFTSV